MIKHYVEYGALAQGDFFVDLSEKELSQDEYENIMELDFIKNCDFFRFFDREESHTEYGDVVMGEKKNISGWFYRTGTVKTLEEVEKEMPNSKLLQKMESSEVKSVENTLSDLDKWF